MKKITAVLLALSLCVSLCGCDGEADIGITSSGGISESQPSEVLSEVSSEDAPSDSEIPPTENKNWPEGPSYAYDISFADIYAGEGECLYRVGGLKGIDMSMSSISVMGSSLLITEFEDSGAGGISSVALYDISNGRIKAETDFNDSCLINQLGEDVIFVFDYEQNCFEIYDGIFGLKHRYILGDLGESYVSCYGVTCDGRYLVYSLDESSELTVIDLYDGSVKAEIDAGFPLWGSFNYNGRLYLTDYSEDSPLYYFDTESFSLKACGNGSDIPYSGGIIFRFGNDSGLSVSPLVLPQRQAILADFGDYEISSYLNGILLLSKYDAESNSYSLCIADLANGKRYSLNKRLVGGMPMAVTGDGFVLFTDGGDLYIWDYLSEQFSSVEIKYTSEKEAAAEIDVICDELFDTYGIGVYYGTSGNDFVSDEYLSKTVTDTYTILSAVRIISDTLALYPEGMIKEMCAGNIQKIDFYLSGSLYSITSSGIDTAVGLTYTIGNTRVVVADISYNLDELDDTVAHELMHVMDDRLEQAEKETGIAYFSSWTELLPDGIDYYYSYNDRYGNLVSNISYTMSEGNSDRVWFVDAYSKTYPTEDRARIMEYLMRGYANGDPDALYGENLLMKARFLCVAVRECFECIDGDDILPWESILGEIDKSEFETILLPNVAA